MGKRKNQLQNVDTPRMAVELIRHRNVRFGVAALFR